MQQKLNNIEILLGNERILYEMNKTSVLSPFSEKVLSFFADLSLLLREDTEARLYSDIQTYAFWCRKGSLMKFKQSYPDVSERMGRGLAFHIAPSNIPLMFLFSMSVSLLAGNPNIVRVSSRDFPQTEIILRVLQKLLDEKHSCLKAYMSVVKYPHSEEITREFSKMCATRMIWGGNHSIQEIRKTELPPWAVDLPFYDRFSLCLIQADQYMLMDDSRKEDIADKFYNDTYFTDQNACSSPQLVVWLGEQVEQAREEFWKKLLPIVEKKYQFQPVQAVDKLAAACKIAVEEEDLAFHQDTMKLCRVELYRLPDSLAKYRCPGGYFFEYRAREISELAKICSRECQTIAYLGMERQEILEAVRQHSFQGVDRIVPVGSTMDFGLQWDGFDFIYSLTKIIS